MIRQHEVPHTNLSPMPTTFFGRSAELERLAGWMGEGRKLITLLGPAGAGKTRLARRFGEMNAEAMADEGGVWFCDLTEARDLHGVLVAVGHALDAPLANASTEARALEQLARFIAGRGPTLLILDNCEQVIDAAARVVAKIGELAPQTIQIATSRESLRVPGEQVHLVSPLDAEGVRLFVDRARSVHPGFTPKPEDAAILGEIVRRLDGLPLAIELAAARMGVLTVRSIQQRLEERFALLAGGPRFATERQRTMRGALDWSWDLLAEHERAALMQCAVFRGGFGLEAAEQILELEGAPAILDVLQSLCEKSLLVAHDLPELGERRYRLYESIRDYAMEKLRESRREPAALDRHADYFAKASAAWGKAASKGEQAEPMRRLAVDLENLLAAHRRALETPRAANAAFTLLRGICELLKRRGPLDLMLSLLDATLIDTIASRTDPTLVGEALRDRAMARHFEPNTAASKIADLTRALEIAKKTKDPSLELSIRSVFASVELLHGEPDAARVHARAAIDQARALHEPRALAKAFADLGACDLAVGRLEEARASLHEALTISRTTGDLVETALYLARLAETLLQMGRNEEARAHADEGLAIARPFDHHRLLAALSGVRAMIAYDDEDRTLAKRYFGDAYELARKAGAELLQPFYRANLGAVLADADDVEGAASHIENAESQVPRFADDPVLAATVSFAHGHLDLARARSLAASGDVQGSLAQRANAQKRLERLDDLDHDFEDVRLMRRRLERAIALASMEKGLRLVASSEHDRTDALVVAEDGQWFRAPNGARVDLSNRPNLRRLLVSLTHHRISASGDALSIDAVFRSSWPGERADPESAANRARVAIARLRKLGLGDVLLTHDGYLLNPDVPVVIARAGDP